MQAREFYNLRIETAQNQIVERLKRVRMFTFLRFTVFLVFGMALYFALGNGTLFLSLFVAGAIVFLWMVTLSVKARLALEKSRTLKKLNEDELSVLSGDWSMFDSGAMYTDGRHAFSNDLDLFAPKGVFGFINRTVSLQGKNALASLILNGSENPVKNNEIISSLSEEIGWTQTFRVAGTINSRKSGVDKSLVEWLGQSVKNPAWAKWMIYLIPAVMVPAFVLLNLNLISESIFTVLLIITAYPTLKLVKKTNVMAEHLSSHGSKVAVMLEQIQSLSELGERHAEINIIRDNLSKGTLSAEKALKEWQKINERFELRMNVIVSIPLNIFFGWDFRQRVAIERWTEKYREVVPAWEQTLTTLEVFISGATMKYNYPGTTFAQFSESDEVDIQGMLHPLLAANKAVSNDVQMSGENQFMILTGPNMAGKSTYLRALGLVFVFANAGFPVFANSVKIPRLKLYSSMRTSDDLSNESSYFHAELTRLRFIMDALERDQKIFILLDEILKGTNSKDKEEGSRRFLKKLQAKGAKGVIATHDLSLCQLSEGNTVFSNGCFDSTIEGENLYFDYSWRPGICQNMNASFLLKQMRLVD